MTSKPGISDEWIDSVLTHLGPRAALRKLAAMAQADFAAAEQRGYERGVAYMADQLELGQQRRNILDETRAYCADLLGCEPSDIVLGKERDMASRSYDYVLRARLPGGDVRQEFKNIPEDALEDDALAADEFEAQVYRDLAHRLVVCPPRSRTTPTGRAISKAIRETASRIQPDQHGAYTDQDITPKSPGSFCNVVEKHTPARETTTTVTSLEQPPGPPTYAIEIEGSDVDLSKPHTLIVGDEALEYDPPPWTGARETTTTSWADVLASPRIREAMGVPAMTEAESESHSAELRRKLAESEALRVPKVYCQGEED